MIRRAVLAALFTISVVAGTTASAAERARLRIVAPADMPFRTLGMSPGAFDGGRTWTLAPGEYVVVQAPPIEGPLTVRCSNGQRRYGLIVLRAGDNVTCTFTEE